MSTDYDLITGAQSVLGGGRYKILLIKTCQQKGVHLKRRWDGLGQPYHASEIMSRKRNYEDKSKDEAKRGMNVDLCGDVQGEKW